MFDLSVVIPAFNSEAHLARAVRSAFAVGAAEVIVVDDGSVDRTAAIAEDLGCLVIRQQNAGAAAARLRGLQKVSHSWTMLLDADDFVLIEGIAKSFELARASENCSAVLGATIARSASGNSRAMNPWPEGVDTIKLLNRGYAPGPPGAFLWRSKSLQKAFNDAPPLLAPRYAEDFEIVVRGSLIGKILTHEVPTCEYAMAGGKSALSPLKSNLSAEATRRHYAQQIGASIALRSVAELTSMAYFRTAYSKVGKRQLPVRIWWTARAVVRDPNFALKLVRRRVGRLLHEAGWKGKS